MIRVSPLPQPWSPEDAAGIALWNRPDPAYDPLLIARCLQRHPELAQKTRAMGKSLYDDGRLSHRQRTLAILRICGLLDCDYEWGGQAAFWGPRADVSDEECDALAVGSVDDPRWSEPERVLIGAVDELEATGTWTDATWTRLGETLDDEQRMELVIVVGWYRMIATLCTTMGLPAEGWMRSWPQPTDAGSPVVAP